MDVDDDGVISLNFECCDMTPDSKFVWSKNYEDITDSSRLTVETKGNRLGAAGSLRHTLCGLTYPSHNVSSLQVQSCF